MLTDANAQRAQKHDDKPADPSRVSACLAGDHKLILEIDRR